MATFVWMSTVFRFKKFEVDQRDCPMKINTDGVLLGAMVKSENPLRILDIGTGTGVIAMMLAQRFEESKIEAVEIDEAASKRASQNFEDSPFHNRLRALFGSFEDLKVSLKYDLMVSNPPFYTNSLHNPDDRKKKARHADFDFFDNLLLFANANLNENGQLTLIVPVDLAEYIVEQGKEFGFSVQEQIHIKSFAETEVIRQIITLIKGESYSISKDTFVIYESKGIYSSSYREVLKPFFLAF